ncbi:class F sortase [Streptomyces sp. SCSIO ZS0520]|uniref:class F sortase n=1 Tax=Streptomyces sp. SCSIO ZS0520 TaxID=2892996 RepID=UPI003985DDAD
MVLAPALALLAAGGGLLALGLRDQQPAPPEAVDKPGATVTVPGSPGGESGEPGARDPAPGRSSTAPEPEGKRTPPLPSSPPVRVSVPKLKVSSSLESLGLDGRRAMETPRDPARAGWYRPGPAPGAQGPAVIAGHVTWDGAPAVFFRLADLDPGDRVDVAREDGRTAEFTVERVARYTKAKFPTIEVYRNLDHAGLRLITCGGTYSEADHRYADNVVVYARLTGSHS